MIVVKVRDRDIKAAPMGPVTTGSVGLPVSWHFSEEWDDLAKTAVFRVGNDGTEITVAVLEDLCLVPDELLVQANAGENLWIGVYGWKGTNANDTIVPEIAMPTIWTYTRIQDGSQPSGIEPPEGTPGWSAQIQNATDEALRVAHGVAADAAEGDFDGISPAVTISSITHGHSVTITDRDHPTGQSFNVMDGASAYEQAVAGGYTGTEAQFNEELASFKELSDETKDAAPFYAEYFVTTKEEIEAAINYKRQIFLRPNQYSSYFAQFAGSFWYIESGISGTGYRFITTLGASQTVFELKNSWSFRTYNLNAPAERAEAAAATALTRMNSANSSAQAAEDASSFFTSTILPNAVNTINSTRDQAVANVNVAKSTAVQNVQAEGATQISAVQTESATQQAAIEQKGEDVLASIPSDYTELSEDVDDLKSAVNDGLLSALYENIDYTLTIGAGVNPTTGGNYNSQARYARTSSFRLSDNRTIAFAILDPTYEYVVWAYSGASASSGTYSPTNSQYVSTWVFIPYTGSDIAFRAGIQRTDHASMTSGDDPSTDESRLKKAIKVVHLPATADTALFTVRNEIARKFGGSIRPVFRQGSGNFTAGYYVETANLATCTTPTNSMPTFNKGDTVSVNEGYECLLTPIEMSGDLILRKKDYVQFTGTYTISESGIYIVVVRKLSGENINIDEAQSAIIFNHRGAKTTCDLPRNPYKHIAKNKIAENDYEWSSLVKDIKSTCHLHTVKALYFTRARLAGYDHIAISNYHASKPTVPIADIIKTLDGYSATRDDVPNTWLENPNAEHVYFTDADSYVGTSAGSHLHLCSVGSYVTSGSDNTSVGEGGFEGTVQDFAKAFEEMRQYPNGGGITINHPVWSGISKEGILNLLLKVPNVFGMEIYNANSEHGNGKGYALDLWDEVLATGNQIFGTAVPDHETEGSFWNDHLPLGFIHLLCITKTDQEVMLAYRNGRFYTTIGNDTLLLRFFGIDDNGLVTFKATDTGTIKFVTAKRTVTVENNNTATFQTQSNDVYIRAEIETATNRLFTNAIML